MNQREFRIICMAIGKNAFFGKISRNAFRDAIDVLYKFFGGAPEIEETEKPEEPEDSVWLPVFGPQKWRGRKADLATIEGGIFWSNAGDPFIIRQDPHAGIMVYAVDAATLEVSECPPQN